MNKSNQIYKLAKALQICFISYEVNENKVYENREWVKQQAIKKNNKKLW